MAGIHKFGAQLFWLAVTICGLANVVYAEELTAEQYFERGKSDNEKSQFAQAIADFTSAINKNPEYWKAYANRGAAKFHSRDYKGAKVDLDLAIPHLPPLQTITDLKNAIEQALANETHSNRNQSGPQSLRTVHVPTYVGVSASPSNQIMELAATLRAHGYKIPNNLVKPFPSDLIHPQSEHLVKENTEHLISSAAGGKPAPSSVNSIQAGGGTPDSGSPDSTTYNTTTDTPSLGNAKKMSAEDYFNRGSEKSKSMDLTGAIKDFDECLNLDPKHGLAYANRGTAKANLGDPKGALEDFDRACDLMPENPCIKDLRDRLRQAIEARTAH